MRRQSSSRRCLLSSVESCDGVRRTWWRLVWRRSGREVGFLKEVVSMKSRGTIELGMVWVVVEGEGELREVVSVREIEEKESGEEE